MGNPCNLSEIKNLCKKKKNIYFVEDGGRSLGAKYKNKFTGTFGDINTMSLHTSTIYLQSKGGMVTTNDKELADLMRSLRSHGWTRDIIDKNNLQIKKGDAGKSEFILPGYNVRPNEIYASPVGISQLKKLDQFSKIRRKNFLLYQDIFKNKKILSYRLRMEKTSAFSL